MSDIVDYVQPRNSKGRFAPDPRAADNPEWDIVDRVRKVETIVRRYAVAGQPSECWHWSGPMFKNGYGRLYLNRKSSISASRAVMLLRHGYIDPELEVCHKCDNRACINPDHLFIGTRKDNAVDKARKGRCFSMPGARNPSAKLTPEQVLEIRARAGTITQIAKEYSVSQTIVSMIKSRKAWKHL